ncbi:MAG: FG-GAP repeat protein [Hyphomonadaceae bacterium]|nr:FG-GAP repeat protein [Hyphomonadaceae bacterium]
MPQYPAVIQLSQLNGANGFRFLGDTVLGNAGFSVASAGDVNGDGFEDILVSAPSANQPVDGAGAVYVIFGRAAGFTATLNPADLNGANGFRFEGAFDDSRLRQVSSAGDFNGDGYGDIIFSTDHAATDGGAYVVFGRSSFSAVTSVSALNGAHGFFVPQSQGSSVGHVDFNDDGLSDLIIGASHQSLSPETNAQGITYVIYGTRNAMSSTFDVATLNGSNGFRMVGVALGATAGTDVGGIQDFNGDGREDLVITAPNADVVVGSTRHDAGMTYVVFGRQSAMPASFDLGSLGAFQGVRVLGSVQNSALGVSASGLGDVNGDGYDDLGIGARMDNFAGRVYVVLGRASQQQIDMDLAGPHPNTLTTITIGASSSHAYEVSGVGDINGDGFNDILIGAYGGGQGAAYVVFGQATMPSGVSLNSLTGENGFKLSGAGQWVGFTVSSGDFNGDGFSDILLGSPQSSNGITGAGEAFIVFGRAPDAAVTRVGSAAAQSILGGAFGDTLDGRNGDDTLIGNGGDDVLIGGQGADALIGGNGSDTASYANSNFASGTLIDLANPGVNDGEAAGDTYSGVENIIGTSLGDTINGNEADNRLEGRNGDDRLEGRNGADTLDGGAGSDSLFGGDGDDTVFYDASDNQANVQGGAGADTLVFTSGSAPTSFNLASHGFEAAEGRLTDTGANAWATRTEIYDALWRLDISTLVNDDGTREIVDLDQMNSVNWSSFVTRQDALGRTVETVLTYDDGVYDVTNLDPVNAQFWTSFVTRYDALGHTTESLLIHDDGTRDTTNFDPDNSQFWTSFVTRRDALGRTTESLLIHDDGVRDTTNYDADNSQFWTSFVTRRDALGRTTESLLIHDDGTRDTTNFDGDGSQFWTSFVTRRDALGRTTESLLIHDDGTRDTTNFDPENTVFWESFVTRRDALGRTTDTLLIYDDGRRDSTDYDEANVHDWANVVYRYDGGGILQQTVITYDDGRIEII